MKTLLALVVVTAATSAFAEFPKELLSLRPLKTLTGSIKKGIHSTGPFTFVPGKASSCEGSGHNVSGPIVIFNCRRVDGGTLTIEGKDMGIRLDSLQVRHQYYRPNPYEKPKPGSILEKGWIRYYTYVGTYREEAGGEHYERPFQLHAWHFARTPERIAVGFVRLADQAYDLLGVRQQP